MNVDTDSNLPPIAAPFRLKRKVALGASSTVFEAWNETTLQTVALKVFHPQVASDAQFFERLKREADTLQQIRHPNVVRLIQPWTTAGLTFLELEYVCGRTLKQWHQDEPADWLEPRLWILSEIAKALGAVHREQIVHRDLKPENILLSSSGQVKLTDFGLAKAQGLSESLTQTGALIGSLSYMAPEAVDGQKASFVSDIFSFGAVAYELLCGRNPFLDSNGQLMVGALLAGKFKATCSENPKVPYEIGQLVDQCLTKDPAARPNSIWRVEATLLEYLQHSKLLLAAKRSVEQGCEVLPEGLKAKHAWLKGEIDQLTQTQARDPGERKKLMSRINEFSALFPNDTLVLESLQRLGQHEKPPTPSWRRKAAVVGLLALGLVPALIYLKRLSPERAAPGVAAADPAVAPTSVPAPGVRPNPTEAPRTINPAQIVAQIVKVRPPRAAVAKAMRPETGSLRVLADDDVRVLVDGRRLTAAQMAKYSLKSGSHILRLEKNGFTAIEKIIFVKAGKMTTINAQPGEAS